MKITKGLNINDSTGTWTSDILCGNKTIETRNQNNLKSLVGKPIGVIQTGTGKARVVGIIKLGKPIMYTTLAHFRKDEDKHLVKAGSTFDWKGIKYGYPIEVIVGSMIPIPVNSFGIVTRKIPTITI